ncbi:MAG: D-alanyl-D-alanine carboxypeptidase family protein [Pseudomonadota bacterium]
MSNHRSAEVRYIMGLFFRISAIFIAIFSVTSLHAQVARTPIPAPPQVGVTSYMLIDATTGSVLASQEPDKRVAPASLTKLMTAYVVFQYLRADQISLADQVQVSRKAYQTPGSRMFIEQGSMVSVEDLIKGMIIQSGNDASVALAEHVAGAESVFADLMNTFAAELGMAATHFENASGLPGDAHYTTARDIARLARAIVSEFPEYYAWYAQREFTYAGIRQENRNRLLWRDSTVDGMKTGHTDAAGFCLVASAARNGMRLVSAVMGAANPDGRVEASQALLNYGFRFYETRLLYPAGANVRADVPVWKGSVDTVALQAARDVAITLPRGRFDEVSARVELPATIIAPLSAGEPLGELILEHDGTTLDQVELLTATAVASGGLWKRMTDEVSLWFE